MPIECIYLRSGRLHRGSRILVPHRIITPLHDGAVALLVTACVLFCIVFFSPLLCCSVVVLLCFVCCCFLLLFCVLLLVLLLISEPPLEINLHPWRCGPPPPRFSFCCRVRTVERGGQVLACSVLWHARILWKEGGRSIIPRGDYRIPFPTRGSRNNSPPAEVAFRPAASVAFCGCCSVWLEGYQPSEALCFRPI